MKKILSLLIIGCAFIVACSTSQSIVDGGSKPSEGQEDTGIKGGEVEVTLYSKDKADTVPSSINFMFYESPVLHYQDSINRMIKTYISGIVSAGGGATEQNSDLSVEYIEESMDKFKDEYNRQLEFVDGGGVWQSETMIEIHEEYPNFAELSMGNWNYMGGAHGNAGAEQHFFDTKTGEKLYLEDFFENIEELTNKAEVIFRGDQELSADESLIEAGFWFEDGSFHLNENFAFNENSIDFLYNQYEIAPYVMGSIIISIPMEEVKHLLKRKVQI